VGQRSGLEVARRLADGADAEGSPVVLASSENDFADLIAASLVVGFLSKAELCAASVWEVLREREDRSADSR
jgi:hypothetical protein